MLRGAMTKKCMKSALFSHRNGKITLPKQNIQKIILGIFSGNHYQITVCNGINVQYRFLD